jgi:hypothetical protein
MPSIVCRTSFVVIRSGRSALSSSAIRAWATSSSAATASISTLIRSEAAIAELPLEGEPAGAFCPRSEFTEQHRPCRRRASR